MELQRYTLKQKYTIKESRDTLEYLVNEVFTEWQIYNVDPDSDNYMTEAGMKSAIEYIISRIIKEMTPNIQDIISVGFPFETEDQMIETIKNKAKIVVLNYSIKQNLPQEHDEIISNINTFSNY